MAYRAPPPPHPLVAVHCGWVRAIDRTTGRVLWVYDAHLVIMRIALAHDRVYALDDNCRVHCIAMTTGALVGIVPVDAREHSACAMIAEGDVLYVSTTKNVIALD